MTSFKKMKDRITELEKEREELISRILVLKEEIAKNEEEIEQ